MQPGEDRSFEPTIIKRDNPDEVRALADKFSTTPDEVQAAIDEVGPNIKAVELYLTLPA